MDFNHHMPTIPYIRLYKQSNKKLNGEFKMTYTHAVLNAKNKNRLINNVMKYPTANIHFNYM